MKCLMSLREAAYHTQISEKTLWRAIQRGSYVARRLGARWYLLMEEIAPEVWVPVERENHTPNAADTHGNGVE
jgi:hypothetical protein